MKLGFTERMIMLEAFFPGIRSDFASKVPLKCFLKMKFSRWPYANPIESLVKVSSL